MVQFSKKIVIFLWGICIALVVFAITLFRVYLDLSLDEDQIVYFLPMVLIGTWGMCSGALWKDGVSNATLFSTKFLFLVFIVTVLSFSFIVAVWGSVVESIKVGSFIERFGGYAAMGFLGSFIYIIFPFFIGYVAGFVFSFNLMIIRRISNAKRKIS